MIVLIIVLFSTGNLNEVRGGASQPCDWRPWRLALNAFQGYKGFKHDTSFKGEIEFQQYYSAMCSLLNQKQFPGDQLHAQFESKEWKPAVSEGDWVDLPDDPVQRSSASPPASYSPPASPPLSSSSTPSRVLAPRKRRVGATVNVSSRKTTQTKRPKKAQPAQPVTTSGAQSNIIDERVVGALVEGFSYALRYTKDVFHTAVFLLKRPLSFLLFLWMFAMVFSRLQHFFRISFAPLCYLPGISSLRLCAFEPQQANNRTPLWADYPSLVKVQSASFEQLLGESVSGSELALEIKKAQLATRDLVTRLRVSNFERKEALSGILSEFLQDAAKASRGLQAFNAKLNHAVDR
jgi:hypothetical protein